MVKNKRQVREGRRNRMRTIYQFLLSFFIGIITILLIGYGFFDEKGLAYGSVAASLWGMICVLALISTMKQDANVSGDEQ